MACLFRRFAAGIVSVHVAFSPVVAYHSTMITGSMPVPHHLPV
jgi:hypothetical protein